jgi:hypothetical protein
MLKRPSSEKMINSFPPPSRARKQVENELREWWEGINSGGRNELEIYIYYILISIRPFEFFPAHLSKRCIFRKDARETIPSFPAIAFTPAHIAYLCDDNAHKPGFSAHRSHDAGLVGQQASQPRDVRAQFAQSAAVRAQVAQGGHCQTTCPTVGDHGATVRTGSDCAPRGTICGRMSATYWPIGPTSRACAKTMPACAPTVRITDGCGRTMPTTGGCGATDRTIGYCRRTVPITGASLRTTPIHRDCATTGRATLAQVRTSRPVRPTARRDARQSHSTGPMVPSADSPPPWARGMAMNRLFVCCAGECRWRSHANQPLPRRNTWM